MAREEYIIMQVEGNIKKGILDQHNKKEKICRRFDSEDEAIRHIRHQGRCGEYNIICIGENKPMRIIIKSKNDLTWNEKQDIIKKYTGEK